MTLRTILPAIIGIAVFSSCASVYRTGQTPDDVYYSPAREGAAYANVEQQRDGRGSYERSRANDYSSYDDRWLRMRVMNRYRWSAFDDYDWNDWRYNTWSYSYYNPYGWNNYWNSYYRWNSWYNPYCGGIIVVNPKTNPVVYSKVRNFSLGSYTNTNYNTANSLSRGKGVRLSGSPSYNNANSGSLGNSIRKVFGGNNNSRNSYYTPSSRSDRPSRTYTPSNSNSSSSSRSSGGSSGGSSGSGVSRPGRGN